MSSRTRTRRRKGADGALEPHGITGALRDEMNYNLLIVPARYGDAVDGSEYEEILPTSPP